MSERMQPGDPAYWMLQRGLADPSWRSHTTVFDPKCYICQDEEFSLMGMALCRPCPKCGDAGHIPADDVECTVCGASDYPYGPCVKCGEMIANDDDPCPHCEAPQS